MFMCLRHIRIMQIFRIHQIKSNQIKSNHGKPDYIFSPLPASVVNYITKCSYQYCNRCDEF